jgi:hypothetical protein
VRRVSKSIDQKTPSSLPSSYLLGLTKKLKANGLHRKDCFKILKEEYNQEASSTNVYNAEKEIKRLRKAKARRVAEANRIKNP